MTTVYFVRHAEPNYNNHDNLTRELTEKGMHDRKLVTAFLSDKNITAVYSSPYKRAYDTVSDFAESKGLKVITDDSFKERTIDENVWIPDFNSFSKAQWADFSYKCSRGESLGEVQKRNIDALLRVISENKDKNIVIGSHGTALSTIVNYYDSSFGHDDFERIRGLMPWIVRFTFDSEECIDIKQFNLFNDNYEM